MPLSNELSLLPTQSSQSDPVRRLDLTAFDLRLDRFRLVQPKAEQLMRRSLAKYGQLAPVVFCQLEGSLVAIQAQQRLLQTRHSQALSRQSEQIRHLHQNAQRLLWPLKVYNLFADRLSFASDRTRLRRDHSKY